MTTSLPKMTAGAEDAVTPPKRPEDRLGQLRHRPEAAALIGTLSVFVFFAIFGGEKFLAGAGTASWLNIAAELGIIAIPVGLLMIAGELDVSVGSVLAGSSMTLAIVSGHWGAPMIVGIVLALALGLLTGLLNGIIVTRSNVPSLVVTLATLFALSGLTLGLSRVTTGTTSVAIALDPTSKAIFGQLIGGQFEVAIFWWIAVAVLVTVQLQMMPYGNWIFAIGGDKESARATGIPVAKVKI